jgi:hypothetical protein
MGALPFHLAPCREVNDYDFKNFATQRTLRNRANVRGVVKRYPAEGDRMWGLVRCSHLSRIVLHSQDMFASRSTIAAIALSVAGSL